MPALAVVGTDHQIIRSTETFRRQCDDAAALCDRAPELDLVLTGQTDTAVIDLGDLRVAVEAVTDAAGERQAMLSLPADEAPTDPETAVAAVRDAAGDSAALVWAKDLEGRYLYVNARYEQYLETSTERLRGNTDADLPPVETVDGPRLRYIEDGLEEPLQLEYSVPAFESRPAMAAFRFPVRNERGQPIATCGVAAPNNESDIARDEAVRLMQLERWNRLDPLDVRAELLEQWHVQATPGPAARLEVVVEPPAEVEAPVEVEPPVEAEAPAEVQPPFEVEQPKQRPQATEPTPRPSDEVSYRREDEWVRQLRQSAQHNGSDTISETADALQSDLRLARTWAERADQLQGDLQQAHTRLREAEAEAQQAVAAAELETETAERYKAELEQARKQLDHEQAAAQAARSELEEGRSELEAARSELEQARNEADAARSELEAARHELGAARAQSESLRGPTDAASRLSEELGRALAAERERGDELGRALARIRSRLGDLETALDRAKASTD